MNKRYAVIRIGGKQLKVCEGDTFEIEHQNSLEFDVLAYFDGAETFLGRPVLDDVKVKATITGDKMSEKVMVRRFKAKSRYRKLKGHRQAMSIIKVSEIYNKNDTPKEAKVLKTPAVKETKEVKEGKSKKAVKKVAAKKITKPIEKATTKKTKKVSK